jgi:hypothetical protein
VHWKIVSGAPIDRDEMPVARQTAEELSGRLRRGLLMGAMFGVFMSIYIPEFMPPADAFSWALLVAAALAVMTYAFGLFVTLRARSWLTRHRSVGEHGDGDAGSR